MLRRLKCDEVRTGGRSYFMARIVWTDGTDLRLRVAERHLLHPLHRHGAVVPAVTTAAGGKAGVGVLRQGQRRCDGWETNGGEQDEAEETREHGRTRPSVRACS